LARPATNYRPKLIRAVRGAGGRPTLAAAHSLIANFLWLPVYPLWSIIIITIDALVIWALTAHGGEMRNY
jgi:hypothetical protein